MRHTFSKSALVKAALRAQTLGSGATNGLDVNCQGFDRAGLVVNVGAKAGTAPTLDIKLQAADDSAGSAGAYADVTSGTIAQITGQNGIFGLDINLGAIGKPWIRAVFTVGGSSTPTFITGADFVLIRGRHLAPTQDNTWSNV